jgi:hypothetical protein
MDSKNIQIHENLTIHLWMISGSSKK